MAFSILKMDNEIGNFTHDMTATSKRDGTNPAIFSFNLSILLGVF